MNIYSNTEKILDAAEKLNEKLNSFLSIEREHALRRARELENNSDENQSLRGFAVAVQDRCRRRAVRVFCIIFIRNMTRQPLKN
jgi:Asp-tRNA(Asn)/Glu-tRNA(Gln) amidotransferase A subunit family amidase